MLTDISPRYVPLPDGSEQLANSAAQDDVDYGEARLLPQLVDSLAPCATVGLCVA